MASPGSTLPVSVVIPCYRCAETIVRAVESVFAQTRLPEEVWLVEDGSSDGGRTITALKALEAKYGPVVRLIVLPKNGGAAAARNAGWESATRRFVAFLDADDAWHPRKLEIQCDWMMRHPETTLTAHDSAFSRTEVPCESMLPPEWEAIEVRPWSLLASNRLPTRAVILRRDVGLRFDPDMRRSDDYLLWLRIVLGGGRAAFLPLPLACHFKASYGEGGLSQDLWAMEKSELNVYARLYRDRLLPLVALVPLCLLSLAKHCRRVWLRFAGLSR